MKKHKKVSSAKSKTNLNKLEIKGSRVTIDSRTCNLAKFNELYEMLDNHTKELKNTISLYCLTNLPKLVTNYTEFKKNYVLFKNPYLNSWEKQNIFQEISGHYYETATRYLSKATYIVQKQGFLSRSNLITKVKTKLNSLAALIDNNSNLVNINQVYKLDFDVTAKLKLLNHYLKQSKIDLKIAHEVIKVKSIPDKFYLNDPLIKAVHQEIIKRTNIDIIRLEKNIVSYLKFIKTYTEVKQFSLAKPHIYQRIINLVTTKKLRLLKRVKLGVYETGTHARHIDNAQIAIVKDLDNTQFKYFLQVRKGSTLTSHEPKFKDTNFNKVNITKEEVEELKALQKIKDTADYEMKLAQYKAANFIYLPLIFNQHKLNQIDRNIDNILSKDNPQILLKSEQLRKGKSSRKIHLIFKYEEVNKLGVILNQV